MTVATHDKQISRVQPWLWLGSGGVTVSVTAIWAAFAALYGQLDIGHGLTMIGFALAGGILVIIGMSERRRAEDWANWQVPAQQIAENNAMLKRLLARPGGEGAVTATYRVREDPPSVDTLNMVEMVRQLRREQAAVAAPIEKPNFNGHHDDPVDPKYLADMSEAVELGKEIERRKNQPPNPSS